MKPLKFPLVSALVLYVLAGVLALVIPLPQVGSLLDVTSVVD